MPLRENLVLDRMPAWSRDRPELRDAQSALLARAQLLSGPDRLLIELAIKNHLTQRQLAQVLSVPSGTVCRRLRRLFARLNDPLIIALLDPENPLPPEHRQLAVEHLLLGRTVSELAEKHEMPAQRVKRVIEFIRGWHRGTTCPIKSRAFVGSSSRG